MYRRGEIRVPCFWKNDYYGSTWIYGLLSPNFREMFNVVYSHAPVKYSQPYKKFCRLFWIFIWKRAVLSMCCSNLRQHCLTGRHDDTIFIHMATSLIARSMGPTWGPSRADRIQVGPMLAPWTLLSEFITGCLRSSTTSVRLKYIECIICW